MNISVLEKRLKEFDDTNLKSIIELLIEAVKEYPLYELENFELYLQEIKKLLGSNIINTSLINDYIIRNQNIDNEDNIWIMSSLSSLLDAIDLMNMHKISLGEIIEKINSIEKWKFIKKTNQISGLEAGVDAVFGVISFIGPVGATIGGIYFIGKLGYEYFSERTLFEKPWYLCVC